MEVEKPIALPFSETDAIYAIHDFKENNPYSEIAIREGILIIDRPWGAEDLRLSFSLSEVEIIKDINHIILPQQFDAIIHSDNVYIEFMFAFISATTEPYKSYIDRTFCLNFNGKSYTCSFMEPSQRLYRIAKNFTRVPAPRSFVVASQLPAFRDFQRLESLGKGAKEYFESRVPRSFYIKLDRGMSLLELEMLCQHVNLMLHYYDRLSPQIIIRDLTVPRQLIFPLHAAHVYHSLPATDAGRRRPACRIALGRLDLV